MKKKNIFLLFAIAIMFSCTQKALCQTTSTSKGGIYLSLADFTQNKLTSISKHSVNKNEVYGYQNAKNIRYRFYGNSDYKIIDTLGFFVYYQYKMEPGIAGKGLVKTDEYYFSVKGDAAIIPLTISNLEKAFSGNDKFRYALNGFFRSDADLIAYDNILKMYKLKYIYLKNSSSTVSATASTTMASAQ